MSRLWQNGEYIDISTQGSPKEISYSEYQNLSHEEKNNGTMYLVPDYPETNGWIDDEASSTTRVWSSKKSSDEVTAINSNLNQPYNQVTTFEDGYVDASGSDVVWYQIGNLVVVRGQIKLKKAVSKDGVIITGLPHAKKTNYAWGSLYEYDSDSIYPIRINPAGYLYTSAYMPNPSNNNYVDISYLVEN